MGTTIISVTYNDKVILGADSRTIIGVYVVNRASDNITQLTDNVYSLALRHSEVEGISRLTTVVPGTDESNSKLMQKLYKLVDFHKVQYLYQNRTF